MATDRNMPFLKFDPSLWLRGKVQLLTNEEKGIFIELIVRIWMGNGKIKHDEFLPRLIRVDKGTLNLALLTFKELGIVVENNECLSIKFVDQQITERFNFIESQRQIGLKGGRPKKGMKPKQKAESRKQKAESRDNTPLPPSGEIVNNIRGIPEELQKPFADYLEVYEFHHGELHQKQIEEIVLSLMRIPAEYRLESVKKSMMKHHKFICDCRSSFGNQEQTRTEPKKEPFREFGGIYAD